jgi:hypothetical protein
MQKAGGFGRTMREFLLRDLPGDAERAAQKIAQEAGRVASGSLLVEHELPDWLGEVLEGLEDGDLLKGAGHKYIRRVPKAGGKGWRYFYTVTGGQGLGHHSEFVKGASFKVKDAGKEGHFHVEEDHGEEVTLRHDESGKSARVSKKALAGMLHAEHAEALGSVRERAAKNLEQAKKTGTPKQQARLAEVVKKYGGVSEAAGSAQSEPTKSSLGSGAFTFDPLPKDAAQGAWHAASWTPEDRQRRAREEYERHLSDLAEALHANTDDTTREHALPMWESYKNRYKRAWDKYIAAARGAVSWAVTGRGNFNVNRANKLNDREHAAMKEYMDVEKEGQKLLSDVRSIPKKLDPIGETRKQLEQEKAEHERKKAANKIIRAGGDALKMHAALVGLGFTPKEALNAMSPDFAGRRGFPDYSLQNGLARIKDHERKLAALEAKEQARQEIAAGDSGGAARREWPMQGGGGHIVDDLDANRLRLHFDGKPDAKTISDLKRQGWRWAPSEGAWSRIRTDMAFYSARNMGLVGEDVKW